MIRHARKKVESTRRKLKSGKWASFFATYISLPGLYNFVDANDNTKGIIIGNYFMLSACVTKTCRQANDWFSGKRSGRRMDNRSTGVGAEGFAFIMNKAEQLALYQVNTYGYVCALIDYGGNEKRRITYLKAMERFIRKHKLCYATIQWNKDAFFYGISKNPIETEDVVPSETEAISV